MAAAEGRGAEARGPLLAEGRRGRIMTTTRMTMGATMTTKTTTIAKGETCCHASLVLGGARVRRKGGMQRKSFGAFRT